MNSREHDRERDNLLDAEIDALVAGNAAESADTSGAQRVAREFARLAAEESPRLSHAARTQGLSALRARAAERRAARHPNPFAFLLNVPRWALIAAVALVVVLVANGIRNVAADALPGSLFYPFKRFGEDGQLFLQNTNGQRARVWMNLANTRLDEVQRLLARGETVAPSALDAVDESILRALGELAGTRGQERVELLQQLTQLAIRQQQIVTQLAQASSPAERARLEQTAKLLEGVASYAQSADAAIGVDTSPFQFLTPSPTALPSITPFPTFTATPTPLPTAMPRPPTAIPSPVPPTRAPSSGSDSRHNNDNNDDNDDDNDNDDNDNDNNDDDNNDNDDNDNDNDDDDDNSGGGGGDDNDDNDDDNSGGGGNDDDKDDNDDDNSGGGGGDKDDDKDDDDDNKSGGDNDDDDDNANDDNDDDD